MTRPCGFLLLALLGAVVSSACASTKTSTREERPPAAREGSGATIDDPVVLLEANEEAGIRAERRWLADHFPGYRKISGALDFKNDRRFDVVTIRLPDGSEKTLFFDVTSFYGFN